jgi:hypothetical protein
VITGENSCVNTTSSINPVVCGTYISPAGNTYTTSANFTETIPNAAGCDSVITISLTVNNASASSIAPVVCGSYISPTGNAYTASTNFTETIPNAAGCDSVITISLTVNNVDTSVTLSGATLTATASGAQYQWIDCGNGNAPVSGATSQSFLPTVNGDYAVIVTDANCTDTSSCVQVLSTAIVATDAAIVFTVSPNPAGSFVTLNAMRSLQNATLTLTDVQGRVIIKSEDQNGTMFTVDLGSLDSGLYILQVMEQGQVSSIRVVKE